MRGRPRHQRQESKSFLLNFCKTKVKLFFLQRTHDEEDESNEATENTGSKKRATPVKATIPTLKNKPLDNVEDESCEETNDEDSNNIDAQKRNGK